MSLFDRYTKIYTSLATAMLPTPAPGSSPASTSGSEPILGSDSALPEITASSEIAPIADSSTASADVPNPSVSLGIPAAQILTTGFAPHLLQPLHQNFQTLAALTPQTLAQGHAARFDDGLGFTRRAYHALLLDLHFAALMSIWETLPEQQQAKLLPIAVTAAQAFAYAGRYAIEKPLPPGPGIKTDNIQGPGIEEIALGTMCLNWIRGEPAAPTFGNMYDGKRIGDVTDILTARLIDGLGSDGEFRPFSPDTGDLLDAWWFRELVCVHALTNIAVRQKRQDCWDAAIRVMNHHLLNTQPDHTTAQPWGVHGFAAFSTTRIFADQQIHDTEANWRLGPGMGGPAGMHPVNLTNPAQTNQPATSAGSTSANEKTTFGQRSEDADRGSLPGAGEQLAGAGGSGVSGGGGAVAGLVLADALSVHRDMPESNIGWSD